MNPYKFDDLDDDEEYDPKTLKDNHNNSHTNSRKAKHIKTYKLRSLNNNSNYNNNNNLHLDTVINKY